MIYLIAYAVFHLICAVWGHGVFYAYTQRQWPVIADEYRLKDFRGSVFTAVLFGPIDLLSSLMVTEWGGKHGFLLWRDKNGREFPRKRV